MTVARKSFIERNPEADQALIGRQRFAAYHTMRIVPESFPFHATLKPRYGSTIRMSPSACAISCPSLCWKARFSRSTANSARKGSGASWKNIIDAGVLSKAVTRKDLDEVIRQELVQEVWQEMSQTEEVKRNLERLQPVVEKYGY